MSNSVFFFFFKQRMCISFITQNFTLLYLFVNYIAAHGIVLISMTLFFFCLCKFATSSAKLLDRLHTIQQCEEKLLFSSEGVTGFQSPPSGDRKVYPLLLPEGG